MRQHPREQSPEVRPERWRAQKHRLCHGCFERARDFRGETLGFRRIERQNGTLIGPHDRAKQPLFETRRESDRRQLAAVSLILPADGAPERRAHALGERVEVFGNGGDVRHRFENRRQVAHGNALPQELPQDALDLSE